MVSDKQRPPSCMGCMHHYVTHDQVFRYGCRAFGIKSQQSPMRVVQLASGDACRLFELKDRK
ncbi:MAG: uracil-DNA glycosylase [Rhodocyclaceae bacterium]|nr:MAG: uracil-DNA glycosylase [Rhodocyclaceae bacterium]